MSLKTLQRAFQAHLTASDPARLDAVDAAAHRGLPVYRHAYRATLGAALRDTYARTAAWLGDDAIDAAAAAFVATTPSASWTLDAYGHSFDRYLAEVHASDPEVGELAWLERALRAAFSAAETHLQADLATVDWSRAVVRLAPAVAARHVTCDVAGIWHALGEDRAPDGYVLAAPIGLVVWRDGLSPRFRTADPREATLLMAMMAGASFATACATLSDTAAETVGGWLGGWLRDGLIAAIEQPD